jgi:hypothetical protein
VPTPEQAADQSPLNAALKQGIEALSEQQDITFTLYARVVLPVDGSVFWVKADMLSPSALLNAVTAMNTVPLNQAESIVQGAKTTVVKGSFHYATERNQDEAENYSIDRVVFTAENSVAPLNRIAPTTLWIGQFDALRFAFGAHALLYQAAGLWHYSGDAVYPDMRPQVVDLVEGFSQERIVSNSLPFWLAMNGYQKQPWDNFGNDGLTLYPSYLLPANISPPFGAVHIPPESTTAIAAAPTLSRTLTHRQLVQETVRVTLWGVRNDQAEDFADFVQQYAASTEDFGIMNQPVIRDEKRKQTELGTLAQKKTIEFQINYCQKRANDVARQLITSVIPTYIFN